MKFRNAAALALIGWYLLLPASAPESGTANAGPLPTASVWGLYKTSDACEQERRSLFDDPVVGPRMKAAKCVRASDDPLLQQN
jgi:hypothetical protein